MKACHGSTIQLNEYFFYNLIFFYLTILANSTYHLQITQLSRRMRQIHFRIGVGLYRHFFKIQFIAFSFTHFENFLANFNLQFATAIFI